MSEPLFMTIVVNSSVGASTTYVALASARCFERLDMQATNAIDGETEYRSIEVSETAFNALVAEAVADDDFVSVARGGPCGLPLVAIIGPSDARGERLDAILADQDAGA
jgi:hypothetical protein